MPSKRDEFTNFTKELLANRVGRKCSNPNCRKLTCGPNENPLKITNIGVAAHICAAAEGGPRFDSSMTSEERKGFDNGIWLCQNCAKLIDSDPARYTKELLKSWKSIAEEYAITEVASNVPIQTVAEDVSLIKFFVQCFDRPAFQDDISQEGHMEDFDKAIEDTIIALNTGVLRTRDGAVLKQSEGKSAVQNPLWREKLNNITDMLVSIRKRLKIAERERAYTKYNNGYDISYYFCDKALGEWFNSTREEAIKMLSSICEEAGIGRLHFPRISNYTRW